MSVRLPAMRAEGDRGREKPRPRPSGPLRKFADQFLKSVTLPRLNGVCFCGSDVIRAVGDKTRSGPRPKTPLSSSQDPSLDSEPAGWVASGESRGATAPPAVGASKHFCLEVPDLGEETAAGRGEGGARGL